MYKRQVIQYTGYSTAIILFLQHDAIKQLLRRYRNGALPETMNTLDSYCTTFNGIPGYILLLHHNLPGIVYAASVGVNKLLVSIGYYFFYY